VIRIVIVLLWPVAIGAIGWAAWRGAESSLAAGARVKRATGGQAVLERFRRSAPGSWGGGPRRSPLRRYAPLGLAARSTVILQGAAVLLIGGLVVFGVMALLGLLVVHKGPGIDKPIYHWTIAHRVPAWVSVNKRLTKIGDTWTTWGAAAAAVVCLAVSRERRKWLPAVVLAAVILVDHFLTLGLRDIFGRPGPPNSPGGTYPSGGCDRVILFYGTIAYLLWRQYNGRRRAAIWASAAVAALAFNEAYTRLYLTLHWFTDVLSGLLYGGLLLGVFVCAIRVADAPTPAYQPADAWSVRGAPSAGSPAERPEYLPG
jgi:membrane-associated phospholipid phosphatase